MYKMLYVWKCNCLRSFITISLTFGGVSGVASIEYHRNKESHETFETQTIHTILEFFNGLKHDRGTGIER